MEAEKVNLMGMTEPELAGFAESLGEKRYRGKQLFQWLYGKRVVSFEHMLNLSRSFRDSLSASARVETLGLVTARKSERDATIKFLFELADGLRIESVLIPPSSHFQDGREDSAEPRERLTLCLSTQVGCPLDCAFCATASMGFARNLLPGEIVGQVLKVAAETGRRVTNVVFMGMGEPLMNYENVMKASEILQEGLGFAPRRITVSTAGRADRIRQMADEKRNIKLAVSLHSAVDATRTQLMPVTKRYSVRELSDAISYYYGKTRRRVTLEQIFFDGVNDTAGEISALVRFARRVSCKVNVIPFHSIALTGPSGLSARLRPSPRVRAIVEHLRSERVSVFVRSSSGEDIDAACGQLAVRLKNRPSKGMRHTAT
jgi:23S rRNA (adenine2503-C2)-methyltransferase